jgi:hypothetical protein
MHPAKRDDSETIPTPELIRFAEEALSAGKLS